MRFRASVQSVNRFNTQPPEGGWGDSINISTRRTCFNTQPPEGGWYGSWLWQCLARLVSTHSRPKAAGLHDWALITHQMFQHTAARRRLGRNRDSGIRPIGFNTQPPEGGWVFILNFAIPKEGFQHTAARRRLVRDSQRKAVLTVVSTHSRPKAAGSLWRRQGLSARCFNTQPPEGGWAPQAHSAQP